MSTQTFNEFLASGEGRLNRDQADTMLAIFTRHNATIRSSKDLQDFMDAHPEFCCHLSDEDKRNGLQTFNEMWRRFEWWKRAQAYDPNYVNPLIRPLRRVRRL
jgi:hypothetical protein